MSIATISALTRRFLTVVFWRKHKGRAERARVAEIELLKSKIIELSPKQKEILYAILLDKVPLEQVAAQRGVAASEVQSELKLALLSCATFVPQQSDSHAITELDLTEKVQLKARKVSSDTMEQRDVPTRPDDPTNGLKF